MNYKFLLTLIATASAVVLAAYWWTPFFPRPATSIAAKSPSAPGSESLPSPQDETSADHQAAVKATLLNVLQDKHRSPHARQGEATVSFHNNEAYRSFLARAAQAGITVLDKIDALRCVRISTESLDGLVNDILDYGDGYRDPAAPNFTLGPPVTSPEAEARAARTVVPLGNNLLSFLGATGDISAWGRGVTIAVIDSGIQPDHTFGTGRLQYIDIGLGTLVSPDQSGGHGTGVAALAAGASPNAQGVAPSANLLGIRVTDQTGQSDIFTVARAIVAAVDRGAQVINLSLGGYGTSAVLSDALDYAGAHGAVVVAAAGNDQAAQLNWPAADPRVISVGAVDALGQQVMFSNSGPELQITAPGYGVQTAWSDGGRVLMDGTSASTPIISGSIAAVMSVNPGIRAADAWNILQQYASEGGPPGADSDYGRGVVNLGWAMARNDPSRIDTAISSHYYNSDTGTMEIVVQNRSGQAVAGLNLDVSVNGADRGYPIARLNPGAVQVVQIPISQAQIAAQGRIRFATQLNNPSELIDQVPGNNRRVSALSGPPATESTPPAGH